MNQEHIQKLEEMRPKNISESDWGMMICQMSIAQVFLQSDIEKDGSIWRYRLHGVVRAEVTIDLKHSLPHGSFRLYHRDGSTLWAEGSYRYGVRLRDWKVYTPDGNLLETRQPNPLH